MTPDAQALAEILGRLNCEEGTQAWPSNWLPDATGALDWVAANLHAEGDAGDALRERLGLRREWQSACGMHCDRPQGCPACGALDDKAVRLVGAWEQLP